MTGSSSSPQRIFDTENNDCVELAGHDVKSLMDILYDSEHPEAGGLHDRIAETLGTSRGDPIEEIPSLFIFAGDE